MAYIYAYIAITLFLFIFTPLLSLYLFSSFAMSCNFVDVSDSKNQ